MTWRELRTFVRHAPRDSAYVRSVHGEQADWGVAEQLLTRIANVLTVANSSKRVPEDKLIHPPGSQVKAKANGRKPGGINELNALFDGG